MEPHNFLEEEIHNIHYIITLVVSNEVCHLRELIDHQHYIILSSEALWEGHDEVHANIIPRP